MMRRINDTIGIARCFNYGGFKNRPLSDPEIIPRLNMTKEDYKKQPLDASLKDLNNN
jgi:hypothetical protein